MNLQDYVSAVLPPAGDYFILRGRDRLRSVKLTSTDAVLHAILAGKQAQDNVYIAAGSFEGRRTQGRCKEKTVLYVDIDYGTDAHEHPQYETKQDAVAAIKAAYRAGLPRASWVVSSGYGFHLYWHLETPVPSQAWQALADTLVAACTTTGLCIDGGITTDAARILRVPFTDNYKLPAQTPTCSIALDNGPVYSESDMAAALNPFLTGPTPLPATDNSDLSEGLPAGRTAHAELMIPACPVMAHAQKTRGADQPGTVWHKILHVLAFCEDGAEFVHPLSDGHPKYNAGHTDSRFNYALTQRQHESSGPTRCDTFATHAPQCASCTHNGRITSPIVLGFATDPTELPFPYRNGDSGLERFAGEEEGWEKVARYDVRDLEAAVDRGNTTFLTFKLGGESISTDVGQFVDRRAVYNVLAQYGVPMDEHEIHHLQRLIVAWIDQLRSNNAMKNMVRSYGWVPSGFHYNGVIYTPEGTEEPTAQLDSTLAAVYRTEGDLQTWSTRANYILSDTSRLASWAVIAAAFAAPLVEATGATGAMLSIVSPESGTGKTTAMRVAQSVWSHPKSGMNSLNDTSNALTHKLGTLNSLPLFWDEVQQRKDAKQFIQLLFRLSQGREKQRLTQRITQRATGEWSTLLCVASNESMLDHIDRETGSSDAGSARVLEVRAHPLGPDELSDAEARHFFAKLTDNYGVAGEAYARILARDKDKIFASVQAVEHALSVKFAAQGGQRFWSATIASMIVAAHLVTIHGICKFDVPMFRAYLEQRFIYMTARTTGTESPKLMTPPDVIRQFLLEHTAYVVRANWMPRRGGHLNETVIDSERLPAVARVAMSEGMLRIDRSVLEDWYYNSDKLGGNITGFMEDLYKHQQVTFVRASIDSGTLTGLGGRHRCVDIRLAGPFAGMVDIHKVADNSDLSTGE